MEMTHEWRMAELMKERRARKERDPLTPIAREAAESCFTDDYVASSPLEQRELEGLGIRISQWTSYDGLAIMKVAAHALEDANFHGEARQIFEWIAKLESGETASSGALAVAGPSGAPQEEVQE